MPAVMRIFTTVFIVFLLWSMTTPPRSNAAANRGIRFEDEVRIDGYTLALQGIGLLKWKYIINVYLVGLYKPPGLPLDRLAENVPKRLEYYFFVDMEADDFRRTGFDLMARNVGKEKAGILAGKLAEFNKLYRDVKAGQRYTLTFLPGRGLEMSLDGEVLGVVEGDEFGSAYLSIWLGPDPVSKSLQEGMFDPGTRK